VVKKKKEQLTTRRQECLEESPHHAMSQLRDRKPPEKIAMRLAR